VSVYRGLGSAYIPSASLRHRMIGQKKVNLTKRLGTDKYTPSCAVFLISKRVHFNTTSDSRIYQNNSGLSGW